MCSLIGILHMSEKEWGRQNPKNGKRMGGAERRTLYDSTFSRTVWRLYAGAKGLVVWYYITWNDKRTGEGGRNKNDKQAPVQALRCASLYDSTFSRTVWRLYGGAKGLVVR
jgi:hypothetical protein